ncbi:MAG: 50S ribosomal protein L10 [Verrucomicrobiota bacterium]|nr:50S ribosomal protein L10 [Verrucomicrobiota bacterium]
MRPEKKSLTEEIRTRIRDASYALLLDYRGMTVQQMTDLRRRLAGKRALLQVVANAFLIHAARELEWGEEFERLVDGPIAVVTGAGGVSEVARILRASRQEIKLPVSRGGRLGRAVLSPSDVEQIASLPPRPEMLAIFVATVAAPMSRLVGVLSAKPMSLLCALKAIEDKKKAPPAAGIMEQNRSAGT